MRVERPHDRRFARVAGVAAAGAGTALGAMAGGWPGAGAGLAAGVGVGLARAPRPRADAPRGRRAALALPFPEKWRAFLLERYDHFERLDPAWRARFEDDVQDLPGREAHHGRRGRGRPTSCGSSWPRPR